MYDGTHKTTILADLNRDRVDLDSYCDVTLQVHEKNFLAHRCILGKLSPFFNKMFKSKMKENYDSTVNIEGVSSELMETILDFIYTAAVDINEENAFELLKASDYFQMDELKSLCAKFLSESLNAENCFNYLLIAQTFDCASLSEEAAKVAASNFQDMIQKNEFNQLSKRNVLNILEAVDQKKVDGKSLYEASLAWVRHDGDRRKSSLVELLKCIDFFLLPASLLQRILTDEPLMKESHDCKDYFLNLLLKRVSFEKTAEGDDGSQNVVASEKDAGNVPIPHVDQEIVLDEDAVGSSNVVEEENNFPDTVEIFPPWSEWFHFRGHPPPPFPRPPHHHHHRHHHHPRRRGGRHRGGRGGPHRFDHPDHW